MSALLILLFLLLLLLLCVHYFSRGPDGSIPFRLGRGRGVDMKSKPFSVRKIFTDFLIGFVAVKSLILFNAFVHWEEPPPHLDDAALISYRHLQDKALTSNDSFQVSFSTDFLNFLSNLYVCCHIQFQATQRLWYFFHWIVEIHCSALESNCEIW